MAYAKARPRQFQGFYRWKCDARLIVAVKVAMEMGKQKLLKEGERDVWWRWVVGQFEQSMPYCAADVRVRLGGLSPACSQGWKREWKTRVELETERFGGFSPGG